MFVLIKAHSHIYIGRNIIVYNIKKSAIIKIKCVIELPNFFKSLHYGKNFNNILANPYLTKQLYVFEITISKENCTIAFTEATSLLHRLRDVNIYSATRFVLTYGYDGLVIIKNKTNIQQQITIFASHHRQEGGIKYAIICNFNNIIVCLGRNGNLIATKIR